MKFQMIYPQVYDVTDDRPDNFLKIAEDESLLDVEMEDPDTYEHMTNVTDYDVEIRSVDFDENTKQLRREVSIVITMDDDEIPEEDRDDLTYWFNSRLMGFTLDEDDGFEFVEEYPEGYEL